LVIRLSRVRLGSSGLNTKSNSKPQASTSSTRVSNAGWTASDSACGFELDFVLRPLEPSRTRDSRITKNLVRSPQDRVRKLLRGMRD
jgi:hypothetical protein